MYIYIHTKSAFRTLQLYILVQLGMQMQTYKHNDLYLHIFILHINIITCITKDLDSISCFYFVWTPLPMGLLFIGQ